MWPSRPFSAASGGVQLSAFENYIRVPMRHAAGSESRRLQMAGRLRPTITAATLRLGKAQYQTGSRSGGETLLRRCRIRYANVVSEALSWNRQRRREKVCWASIEMGSICFATFQGDGILHVEQPGQFTGVGEVGAGARIISAC